MSKTYFGRCAAVGIAGLTAMSSIAIVASAATQSSLVYELKYGGIDDILMKPTVGYATGANEFCKRGATAVSIDKGFNVDFTDFAGLNAKYSEVTVGANNSLVVGPATTTVAAWANADFADISDSMTNAAWEYKAPTAADPTNAGPIALEEQYAQRVGTGDVIVAFKTETERTSAKSAMIANISKEYTALATPANTQFRNDINAAAAKARTRITDTRDTEIAKAKAALGTSTTAADVATYNAAVQTANNKYSAAIAAVNNSASKIVSEFTQTFNANSFNYELAFTTNNAPIALGASVGGLSPMAGASYTGLSAAATDLDNAKYWNGSSAYVDKDKYLFAGEIQPGTVFTATNQFVYIGNTANWMNYEVLKNETTNGGNTTPSGSTTNNDTKKDNTTTVTTWYPDSAAYRAASEVSYLGKNGSWYTSSSAATLYGGGYTGTSKNSNYSNVNSANNGKAIYFDSTSGTYTTAASSYSYVVKEATTTTNDDPYYNYFFGNKNNNTTTSVPAGSPAISGASKYAGWTNISAYITNRAKSGATYTINMNDGTVVPAAVLAAAKAKNVTLVFANDNGSKVTVKPGKVSTTSDLNVAVTYNVKDVKSSLVKKAKKVNKGTVSTAQVRIGTDGSIGGTETVTVKFSTKRAGCTVKAYRLTESGSLKKEASGTVASTGRANLNLTKGGSYLLVVID